MGEEQPDRAGAQDRRGRRRTMRLGVLLGLVVALVAYLILQDTGGSQNGPVAALCASEAAAPEVRRAAPAELSPLREQLGRVVPNRVARLYEEGTIHARAAWNDQEPSPPLVSPTARRPEAYEMRWWAPNGDDVVGDVFVFANARTAQRFFGLATSTHCRRKAARARATITPGGVNLTWLNPDGAAQADVYLVRGAHVYRLADAPAGQSSGTVRPGSLTHALATLEVLGCLLPGAHCSREGRNAVPA